MLFADAVCERWDALNKREVLAADGDRERLIGLLQRAYCLSREAASRQYDRFLMAQVGEDDLAERGKARMDDEGPVHSAQVPIGEKKSA